MNTITPELVSAIVAVISIPVSIWAILSARKSSNNVKQVAKKLGITMKGNTIIRSGTMVYIGDKKEKK